MTKDEFIKCLDTADFFAGNITDQKKLECLQFYIYNYPVYAYTDPVNGRIRGLKHWTKLEGISLTGGTPKQIDFAFLKLCQRIQELKAYQI